MCHTLCLLGGAFRFWDGVIAAAAVVVQFSLFRYLRFFIKYYFDFLDNFIFVFPVFLIFIVVCSIFYYYCVVVHYFSTSTSALVCIYMNLALLVQACTISLAWVSIRPWRITCLRLVGDFSSIYYYYRPLNLGLFTVHFNILISLYFELTLYMFTFHCEM